jgi:hypothetical protein
MNGNVQDPYVIWQLYCHLPLLARLGSRVFELR